MNERNNIPMEYQPISMWGYFGYEILFAIPCIGWILLLVFAFGGTRNINVRNFARSYFCLLIIVAVLFGIFMLRKKKCFYTSWTTAIIIGLHSVCSYK